MLPEGIFGAAVGTTASVENVGLLGLTHIGSRRAVQISTTFMFFFSIFGSFSPSVRHVMTHAWVYCFVFDSVKLRLSGKFGAFFASIPLSIFAAMYCVLFGIVAAVGITFIQFANNNSLRNIYVLGLSLFLGISIPQYFVSNTTPNGFGPVKTDGIWFDDILNTIFSSSPTVATIVGTLLDNTLHARHAANDRGLAWWRPFRSRKGDARNEEFYSLPVRIREYIPTRFLY
ncbi:nucleobase-ascorbate transporter 3-like [Pyrus communis]|uniref:nucleobase-ascorbate transporter 3-like n=1 Tax=Pyrus communis TaxID=23211 RepID=UPI0035BF47A2